jgi:integrase/recombinase XerD
VAIDSSLETFLNHLSVERGASKHTLNAYRRDLYFLLSYLAPQGKNLATAVEDDLNQYIVSLRTSGLKESTIARKVVAIRSLYAFLSKESGQKNIALEIDVPKIPKRLPKALSITEITSLIESTGLDGAGIRDRALLELLYSSGARISEVIGLNVGDISYSEEGFATLLVRGKGGKDRIIPIGSFARKALDDYLVRIRPTLAAKKASSTLFLNLRGGRLSRQAAWNIVLTAAKKAGLERKVSPHALRHSFATHLLDGGADIRVVQELLGHSSVTTTQIYTLVTIDKLRESYAAAHPRSR